MKEWLSVFDYVLAFIAAFVTAVLAAGAIVIIALVFAGLFVINWALGMPISIKRGGKKIGYVRWFTFHSTLS